jgi:homoserine dehydrogenase
MVCTTFQKICRAFLLLCGAVVWAREQECPAENGIVAVHIIGLGGVGRELVSQLQSWRTSSTCGENVRVVSISDSRGWIVSTTTGFSAEILQRAVELKGVDSMSLDSFSVEPGMFFGNLETTKMETIVAATQPSPSRIVVVDCSASGSASHVARLQWFRSQGARLVLANKKPLADVEASMYAELVGSGLLPYSRFEATVGAGLPVISILQRQIVAGDVFEQIQGMLSGTLGLVLDQLQRQDPPPRFSAVVREALAAGFTEPDPREDLSGNDVARKALILSRACGGGVADTPQLADLEVESLFPPEMGSGISVNSFLDSLPSLDEDMATRLSKAAATGKLLRYLATLDFDSAGVVESVKVGLVEVEKDGPFGDSLTGTDNLVSLTSKMYSRPLLVQGAGAGREVTAAAVLADLVELAGCR